MTLLRYRVTDEEIAEVLSCDRYSGLAYDGERKRKIVAHGQALHQRVVGQHEAVEAVANAIRRSRAPDFPIQIVRLVLSYS